MLGRLYRNSFRVFSTHYHRTFPHPGNDMVDLSKHLVRAKQAVERRSWALAIEICDECLDVEPSNLEVYKIHLDASRRRAKESDKKGFSLGMPTMSKDPHKLLTAAMKKVAASPDAKTLAAAG